MRRSLIVMLLMLAIKASAQQLPQYTQYFMNQYALNPAVGGTEDYLDLKAGFRSQWVNFDGAPVSFYVSAHGPIGKPMTSRFGQTRAKSTGWHGIGGMAFNDITGPTSRSAAYLSYSYNLGLTKKVRLSMGAFAGVKQARFNADQFVLHHQRDELLNGVRSVIVPDLIIGSWLYSDKYYLGISVHQILQNDLHFDQVRTFSGPGVATNSSKLNNHYFLTAGYNIEVGYDLTFVPSIMVKFVNPAPASIDLGGRVSYKKDLLWAGAAYRGLDAMCLFVGMTALNGRLPIGYSFDLAHTRLISYNYGSHEIMVGYRFTRDRRSPCPAKFWN